MYALNYRAIYFINTAYKVLSVALCKMVKVQAVKTIGEC